MRARQDATQHASLVRAHANLASDSWQLLQKQGRPTAKKRQRKRKGFGAIKQRGRKAGTPGTASTLGFVGLDVG